MSIFITKMEKNKPIKYTGHDINDIIEKLHKVIEYNTKRNYKTNILCNILEGYKKYKSLTIKQVDLINSTFDKISNRVEVQEMIVISKSKFDFMCEELDRLENENSKLKELLY